MKLKTGWLVLVGVCVALVFIGMIGWLASINPLTQGLMERSRVQPRVRPQVQPEVIPEVIAVLPKELAVPKDYCVGDMEIGEWGYLIHGDLIVSSDNRCFLKRNSIVYRVYKEKASGGLARLVLYKRGLDEYHVYALDLFSQFHTGSILSDWYLDQRDDYVWVTKIHLPPE